jgi:hypothetical protein
LKAIDRVMNAYLRTRSLTAEQAAGVRAELSIFIDELVHRKIAASKPPAASSEPGTK